jgi:hypothetical protein
MRKCWIAKAAVAASVLACVGVANAQTNGPTGISARLGVFFPTSDLGRDIGKTWLAFGADYKLREMPSGDVNGRVSYISLSGDYYEKDGTRAIPIAANYNIRVNQLVFSAGVGIDFVRLGSNSSGLSGQLGAAYEFANSGSTSYNPFFVQAKYFFSSKSDLSGFGVYVGYRF